MLKKLAIFFTIISIFILYVFYEATVTFIRDEHCNNQSDLGMENNAEMLTLPPEQMPRGATKVSAFAYRKAQCKGKYLFLTPLSNVIIGI